PAGIGRRRWQRGHAAGQALDRPRRVGPAELLDDGPPGTPSRRSAPTAGRLADPGLAGFPADPAIRFAAPRPDRLGDLPGARDHAADHQPPQPALTACIPALMAQDPTRRRPVPRSSLTALAGLV